MISTKLDRVGFCASTFPTTDGNSLSFTDSLLSAELEIDVLPRKPWEELPTDVLVASLLVPDTAGETWKTTSLVTAESVINLAADLMTVDSELVSAGAAPEELSNCFKRKVLSEIRFSSDDRFFRRILIDDQPHSFQFKYTTITFDLAFCEYASLGCPKIAVFVRPNSLYNEEREPLPAFYYLASWDRLFQANTAVYSEEYEGGIDDPLPRPLVFARTGRQATPNVGVSCL